MSANWIRITPGLTKGIHLINLLELSRFEQFLNRILVKLKMNNNEVFSQEEQEKLTKLFKVDEESLVMSIKTLKYLLKKMLKFIFVPLTLRTDLKSLGLCDEKADVIVKVWSSETRPILDQFSKETSGMSQDDLNFTWKLNAELSSDYCKKTKIPKAYLSLTNHKGHTEIELTHSELYSMFINFEQIQNELDNL